MALSILAGSNIMLSGLQVALNASNVAVAGTTDRVNATAAVQMSQLTLDSEINSCSSTLSTTELGNITALSFAGEFATKVAAAGSLAAAVNAQSYIARIGSRLNDFGA